MDVLNDIHSNIELDFFLYSMRLSYWQYCQLATKTFTNVLRGCMKPGIFKLSWISIRLNIYSWIVLLMQVEANKRNQPFLGSR